MCRITADVDRLMAISIAGCAVQPWRKLKWEFVPVDDSKPPRQRAPPRLTIELIRREPSETFLKLNQCSPLLQRLRALSCTFLSFVCECRTEALDGWLVEARDSGVIKLVRFVEGLEQDLAAMREVVYDADSRRYNAGEADQAFRRGIRSAHAADPPCRISCYKGRLAAR
jgi:hypothetical protein